MEYINIFAGGDVLNYTHPDGKVFEDNIEEIVQSTDYAICNFEAPVTGFGTKISKTGPHHNQRLETIKGLKAQGFNLLLLANNHIMDFGVEGLAKTLEEADKYEIDVTGAGLIACQAYCPLIKNIHGIRIGIVNACEAQFGVLDYNTSKNDPGYAWINHHLIDRTIRKLRSEVDYILVFPHAGLEHFPIPQREWRLRYRQLCEAGADVIIGSHPHVPQGFEKYENSWIFYSLGNLYFDSPSFAGKSDPTYSLVLHLPRRCRQITFSLIYHHKRYAKTTLAHEAERIKVDDLNSHLTDINFKARHDEMCLTAYSIIAPKIKACLQPAWSYSNIRRNIRNLIAPIFGKAQSANQDTILLHLLRNESYYYALKHALEMKHRAGLINERFHF